MARKKDSILVKVKKRILKQLKRKKKVKKVEEKPKKKQIAYDKENKSIRMQEILAKLKRSPDLKALSNFIGYVIVYGIILNGALTLFRISFGIQTIFACGLLVYFIENKFVSVFRALIRK